MIRTRISEMFGSKYPFLGGAMMNITTPEFVAAVSEAGGVGILASVMYDSKESFREAIKKIRGLTDKPFAINLNLFPSVKPIDNNAFMDVILEEKVKIVETSGNRSPDEIIARLKPEGVLLMHKCVGLKYALKVASQGVDAVTVVGCENGGAIGKLDITTLCLVPVVVNAVKQPVIGGGGIASGRGAAAVLSLGAEGIIIGTRLLLTEECPIHINLKNALLEANETDTTILMRAYGNSHRCWNNSVTKKVRELEDSNAPFNEILPYIIGEESLKMFKEGDLDKGYISCGQSIGQADKILPVKELFQQMEEEMKTSAKRMSSMFAK